MPDEKEIGWTVQRLEENEERISELEKWRKAHENVLHKVGIDKIFEDFKKEIAELKTVYAGHGVMINDNLQAIAELKSVLTKSLREIGNYLDTDRFEYLINELSGEKTVGSNSIALNTQTETCGKSLKSDSKPEEPTDDYSIPTIDKKGRAYYIIPEEKYKRLIGQIDEFLEDFDELIETGQEIGDRRGRYIHILDLIDKREKWEEKSKE
jgi:cobalamin biosynthesis Co2+ chelatase CbiK